MTLYTNKESNIRKTWLLFTIFLIVVIGLGWIFSRIYGNPGILFFAVGFSILMSFLSYWYSDKIVIGLSKAKPVTRENARELYNVVENLCITAGLPTPKIYLIEDSSPNAFATGRNPQHAVVAVSSGLLGVLDRSELEGVLAHELSHIGNRDMLLSTMVVVLVGFVALLSDIFLRSMFWRGVGSGNRDRGGQAGAVLMLIGLILALLSPLIATLIRLAISRKREFLADASGALLTRYPEGLARALEKIEKYSKPMKYANKAMAHLYIANPFSTKNIAKLFMTHPPIEERVKALRDMSI
ncbi:MAG: Protease HtpX-like protein [Parcubacteria group bacterium GW2011_GWB1_41_6]|nr:MAG: Protease HtpX-like protein [Parcubacteria group bacterium GW2011_GWB1_41_6]KKS34422.1 MAG: Protease HtpX-like protein [Parcubacteria group bacterium GW2011_GWC2_42_13]HLD34378.1 M48 family metallopeptidase [Patescibacteria group bacterium]